MARYIDAYKLINELTISPDGTKIPDVDCDNFPVKIDLRLLRRFILRQPTADVVEVKHGHWIMEYYETRSTRGRLIRNKTFTCSNCNRRNGRITTNYCPNCGAKMDGGNAE